MHDEALKSVWIHKLMLLTAASKCSWSEGASQRLGRSHKQRILWGIKTHMPKLDPFGWLINYFHIG